MEQSRRLTKADTGTDAYQTYYKLTVILRTDRPTDDRPTTDLCSWKSLSGRTSNGRISITVLDRRTFTIIDYPQKVEPLESNGHVADDVICGVKKRN